MPLKQKRKPAPRSGKAERGARQGAVLVEAVGLAPDRSGRPYKTSAGDEAIQLRCVATLCAHEDSKTVLLITSQRYWSVPGCQLTGIGRRSLL